MKKSVFYLIAFSLLFFGPVLNQAQAQAQAKSKTDKVDKADKEREMKMQEEIEAQKKAIYDQKKLEELERDTMDQQWEAMDKAFDEQNEKFRDLSRHRYIIRDLPGAKDFRFDFSGVEPWMNFSGGEPYIGSIRGGDGERSSWIFSKSIKDKSFSRDYTFDVEQNSKTVVMSVNGDCKNGEIHIKIITPSGKTYSDIAIDEFGNLNWRKSFTMSDDENQDKAGEWKFQIKASKASGFFKIALQTF